MHTCRPNDYAAEIFFVFFNWDSFHARLNSHYTDGVTRKRNTKRLMFCSYFSFTIFSLIFFPLLPKVFTDILKIYELPKIYNKIPKYYQTLLVTIIIYQANFMSQLHLDLNYTPINFTGNVHQRAKDFFGTKFKKILSRIFFLKSSAERILFFFCIRCCPYPLQ